MERIKYFKPLFLALSCLMMACNSKSNVTSDSVESARQTEEAMDMELSKDPFDYDFILDDIKYRWPVSMDKLMEDGWMRDENNLTLQNNPDLIPLKKADSTIYIVLQSGDNNGIDEVKIMESDVEPELNFQIFGGIALGLEQVEVDEIVQKLFFYCSGDAEYFILDDVFFQEQCGYKIGFCNNVVDSITIKFPAGSENREAMEDQITNFWRNDPVKDIEGSLAEEIQTDIIYCIDTNPDTNKIYADFKYLDYENGTLLSIINGTVNILRLGDVSINQMFLLVQDTGACAAVFNLDETDNYSSCCIYTLIEGRCEKTAEIKGQAIKDSVKMGHLSILSYDYVIGAGWSNTSDYIIMDDFQLERSGDSSLMDIEGREGIRTKADIPVTLFDEKNGNPQIGQLPAGTVIQLLETDFRTYIRFKSNNGISGIIPVEMGEEANCCIFYINGKNLSSYFEEASLIYAG